MSVTHREKRRGDTEYRVLIVFFRVSGHPFTMLRSFTSRADRETVLAAASSTVSWMLFEAGVPDQRHYTAYLYHHVVAGSPAGEAGWHMMEQYTYPGEWAPCLSTA